MTAQEAYDQIRAYFSREDAKLAKTNTPGRTCWYRIGKEASGPGCAVGCLIPDELYDPHLDNLNDGSGLADVLQNAEEGDEVCEKVVEFLGIRESDDLFDFLQSAQFAHDGALTVEAFFESLDRHATEAGLKVASS